MIPNNGRPVGVRCDLLEKINSTTTARIHELEILENTGLLQAPTLLKLQGSSERKSLHLGTVFLQNDKKK